MTTFVRLVGTPVDDKPMELLKAVNALRGSKRDQGVFQRVVFEGDAEAFSVVPGSPFAYWVSVRIREIFRRVSAFEGKGRTVKQGLGTVDDFRFVRTWWETSPTRMGSCWFGFAKGGAFSLFYSDVYLTVNWLAGGYEIYTFNGIPFGTSGAPMRNPQFYFRPGLTWPRRTQSGLGMRVLPASCIFADKGPAAFVDEGSPADILALLAITTSSSFLYLVELQMAFGSYEVGVIQRTPVPAMADEDVRALAQLARRAWAIRRRMDSVTETSHAFLLPAGLHCNTIGLDQNGCEEELQTIRQEIDDRVFILYGIDAVDRVAIDNAAKGVPASSVKRYEANGGESDEDEAPEDDAAESHYARMILSWLVGVAFGRFDIRTAVGERPIPADPQPFDPMPVRSPGMFPEGQPLLVRPPDIMVDDSGHDEDICSHVASALAKLGRTDPEDLRQWLAREFFPLHIKMYSKSRRKAPIYWQLATASGSYSVWLYIQAFSNDTFFRVQNDFVGPKLAHEERSLHTLEGELREKATASERKTLAAQEAFVEELRAFLDEVMRVAPLWKPNLDDGVIINFAPLWRLVPQHKPWQKEVKSTWDALCDGKYDWTHLAMHLWPERVVPKCARDRSLAIAHGLEEVFWAQAGDGKWTAREIPTRSLIELVLERTSPAVKAALASLLEAPATNGGRRVRVGRQRSAGADRGGSR